MLMDPNNNTTYNNFVLLSTNPEKTVEFTKRHCTFIKILATTGLPVAVAVHFYVPS